jgi:hypothetical protein
MSWVSKFFHLDGKPELKTINAIGNTVLSGVEAASPTGTAIVNLLETIGSKPLTPISAVSDLGAAVVVFDPDILKQAETAVDDYLTAKGHPEFIDDINALIAKGFSTLGVPIKS